MGLNQKASTSQPGKGVCCRWLQAFNRTKLMKHSVKQTSCKVFSCCSLTKGWARLAESELASDLIVQKKNTFCWKSVHVHTSVLTPVSECLETERAQMTCSEQWSKRQHRKAPATHIHWQLVLRALCVKSGEQSKKSGKLVVYLAFPIPLQSCGPWELLWGWAWTFLEF